MFVLQALSFFTHTLFMLILFPLFMIAVMHFCRCACNPVAKS